VSPIGRVPALPAGPIARTRRALLACVVLSFVGHAVVVALTQDAGLRPGDGAPVNRLARAMQVRLMPAPEVPLARPQPPVQPRVPLQPNPASDLHETVDPSVAPVARRDPAPEPEVAMATTTTTVSGVEYLPRAMLSVVPTPKRPLGIPFPPDGPAEGRFSTILALFVEETGDVRRIRLDGAGLPASLEAAARNAFLTARWEPGQREGHVVKSLIRVEVTFESGSAVETIRVLE
jgi:hypothetical protein